LLTCSIRGNRFLRASLAVMAIFRSPVLVPVTVPVLVPVLLGSVSGCYGTGF
jgi:hypothetical protein